jgi:rhodanese-related sulfurtransferase
MSTAAKAAEPKPTRKLEVSRDDLISMIASGTVNLYDVREPTEIEESGKIASAINVPLSIMKASFSLDDEQFRVKFGKAKPAKDSADIVFYGFCSVKSTTALEIAHKLGFKKARHYPGGWEEWSRFIRKS